MTVIDFGQLMREAGEGFQPVPSGPYNAEVTKSAAVVSSTGKPMIKVTLRIVGGPHEGRQLFDQFVITAGNPNALAFFFEHMAAFGLDRAYFAQNPPLDAVAAALMGRQVMVSVGVREFKGADRNEVQAYKPIAGGQIGVAAPAAFGPGAGVPAAVPQVAPPPVAAPVPQAPVPQAPPPAPVPQAPVAAPAPVPQAPMAPVAPPAPAPVAPPPAAIVPPPAAIAPPAPVAPPQPVAPVAAPAPVPASAPVPAAPAVPQQVAPAPVPPAAYSSADEEPF